MPGLTLVARETTNLGCNCNRSRAGDQMCHQESKVHLSSEEAIAAEESLSVYCKPVELYNILQRRALRNPSFLQRCLHYKIEAKRKKRMQMTISLSGIVNAGAQAQDVLPLYVLLARAVPDNMVEKHSVAYRLSRACVLTAFSESGRERSQATFIMPELNKLLAEAKSGSLSVLLVTFGETRVSSGENNLLKDHSDLASIPSKFEGQCLWGKLPVDSLYSAWEKCASLSLGHRSEMLLTIDMWSSFLEPSCLDVDSCITFQTPHTSGTTNSLRQVKVNVLAHEVGAKERSPYESYAYNDVPTSSLSQIIRLRTGNVIFNYRYYDNTLQKTEVTEDFSCPFCLVQCASFKGLRYHLSSSHDLFNFEFWVTEEYQAVNVSVKTDIWRSEIVADGVDPRHQTFLFCSKPRRLRRSKSQLQNAKHVHAHVTKMDSPEAAGEGSHEDFMEKDADGSSNKLENKKVSKALFGEYHMQSRKRVSECCHPENPCALESMEPVASSSNMFAKTRKLSVERPDPRNHALLQKRQFFHSHRAQPMELEQVYSDQDSEDEVDDDIADFEDRRLLDDFVDVTKDEKQIMHLWNSFVRKQRVLADGHIPWACEAFSKLHGPDLVQVPALIWCWRLFMIKLWNHNLLDARTMNNCNIILESYQERSDPKQS
ncbi:hypothetical protein AAC387_Pa08g1971 [Persea americana]